MPIYTDSKEIVGAAEAVMRTCQQHGMNVPKLQDILAALVATKLCKSHWQKVVQSAAPEISMHMKQLFELNAAFVRHMQSKPVDALHIMTMANLSTNATKNGDFMNFSQNMGYTVPTPLTQMMYFTLGSLAEAKSHLWHSNLMIHALNMTETQISDEILPKIETFSVGIEPDRLSESYAQLLSGITFDVMRLDPNVLTVADFPCQRPIKEKEDRQKMRADLYYLKKNVEKLKANANPAMVTQKDVEDFERMKNFVKTATPVTKRTEIRTQHTRGLELQKKFKECQLTERQVVDNLRQTIIDTREALARAKEKVNHKQLEAAQQSAVIRWEMPSLSGLGSGDLRKVLAEVESKLALVKAFQKT